MNDLVLHEMNKLYVYLWQRTDSDFIFLPPMSSPPVPPSVPSPPRPLEAHSLSSAELAAAISTLRLAIGVKGVPVWGHKLFGLKLKGYIPVLYT